MQQVLRLGHGKAVVALHTPRTVCNRYLPLVGARTQDAKFGARQHAGMDRLQGMCPVVVAVKVLLCGVQRWALDGLCILTPRHTAHVSRRRV